MPLKRIEIISAIHGKWEVKLDKWEPNHEFDLGAKGSHPERQVCL